MESNNEEKESRLKIQENGPYFFYDVNEVTDSDGKKLAAKQQRVLCRCGGSKYKPFCDGSHLDNKFTGPGKIPESDSGEMGETEDQATPSISIEKNGPYRLKGKIKVVAETESESKFLRNQFLCRCGKSYKKPFCDGSHQKVGFRDDGWVAIFKESAVSEELTRITVEKREMVIVKQSSGFSVFSGVCLHAEALLAEGFIEESYLTCGRHRWRYDIATGELDGDPNMKLKKLDFRVEDDWILIKQAELMELVILDDD